MDLSRNGGSSTIGMGTRSTTRSRTLPVSPVPNMPGNMGLPVANGNASISTVSDRLRPTGIAAKRGAPGIGITLGTSLNALIPRPDVLLAANSSRLEEPGTQLGGSAQPAVVPAFMPGGAGNPASITRSGPVPSVERPSSRTSTGELLPVRVVAGPCSLGVAPVYNLEVADAPEFFANGVLVHNCVYTLLHIFGAKTLVGQSKARLSAPSASTQLITHARPGNHESGIASIYSMDMMERRGPF